MDDLHFDETTGKWWLSRPADDKTLLHRLQVHQALGPTSPGFHLSGIDIAEIIAALKLSAS